MAPILRGFIKRTRRWRVRLVMVGTVPLAVAALITLVPGSGAQQQRRGQHRQLQQPGHGTDGRSRLRLSARAHRSALHRAASAQSAGGSAPARARRGPGAVGAAVQQQPDRSRCDPGLHRLQGGGRRPRWSCPAGEQEQVVYWDALAGTENVELTILSEYRRRRPERTDPADGPLGSGPDRRAPRARGSTTLARSTAGRRRRQGVQPASVGTLFTTNFIEERGLAVLRRPGAPRGRPGVRGRWDEVRNDPGNDQSKFGATELEGIRSARIYNAKTNSWTQTGSMNKGRWYGTLVTLGNGNVFETSGLAKLSSRSIRTPH